MTEDLPDHLMEHGEFHRLPLPKAVCTNEVCRLRGKTQELSRSEVFCPRCGYALYWEQSNFSVKAGASYRSARRHARAESGYAEKKS